MNFIDVRDFYINKIIQRNTQRVRWIDEISNEMFYHRLHFYFGLIVLIYCFPGVANFEYSAVYRRFQRHVMVSPELPHSHTKFIECLWFNSIVVRALNKLNNV